MSWNYRILKHDNDGDKYVALHEVFYNKKGKPHSCTKNPIDVMGNNSKGLIKILKMMLKDAKKSKKKILNYEDF